MANDTSDNLPAAIMAWMALPMIHPQALMGAFANAPPRLVEAAIDFPLGCIIRCSCPLSLHFHRVIGHHIRHGFGPDGPIHLRVEALAGDGYTVLGTGCLPVEAAPPVVGYRGGLDSMVARSILRPDTVGQA
jgi:hypothetical protein